MKKVIWSIQALFFYLFTLAFSILPKGLVRPVGCLIGTFGFVLIPKRRHIAINNIRQSLPAMMKKSDLDFHTHTPEKITHLMFCHLGISLVETCRLYHSRGEEVLKCIEVRGWEYLEAARARGKGVVVLTGHCGNWELAALALAQHFNSPMSVVARRQNNPYLNRLIEKMRLRYGNLIIYKNNALRGMMSVIRKNGMIALLVDQAVFPESGVLVDFLGRKAWASKAPVLLARKLGTAVVPAFIHREADRHIIEIHPELMFTNDNSEQGMAADVQKYSRAIENFIVRHPVDWYWVHRRWKRAGESLTE
ncbi:MAG: lysophospholipid acyltransferase family protein [Desulfuromonadaceae bacterium]|nr:lysophospholipid acyltransferase family protein [Desulfuromonadaceae bacterium]